MKAPKNKRKAWTDEEVKKLQHLVDKNTPTGLIAYNLGRTESSIQNKASSLGISLKPTNKPPYDKKVSNAKKGLK